MNKKLSFGNYFLIILKYNFFLIFILLASCQTMQRDLFISSIDESVNKDIGELETLIVALDAEQLPGQISSIRERIIELERKPLEDTAFRAALAAWSGRLYIIENRISNAQEQLRVSNRFSPGNIQAVVLSSRIEKNIQKRFSIIDDTIKIESDAGELYIELARILAEQKNYSGAAAAFDTAFSKLHAKIYEKTYRSERDKAWELKDIGTVSAKNIGAILEKQAILWRDAIELTKRETRLLYFITSDKNWSNNELFERLKKNQFIPAEQSIESASESPQTAAVQSADDVLTRSGAAWFLWWLTAENRFDKTLIGKNFIKYKNSSRSPIEDVPVNLFCFDSVVGCVEEDIIPLQDGKNFFPAGKIKGSEFLRMLKNIER
jgi:tetratricopeptide (TPR) repeat protein